MNVPFFRPSLEEPEIQAVVQCLRSGWLTTGPLTRQFEAAFAEYLGVRHAVAVNSCTAALHLALDAIGLRRGDVVLVPAMTFAATAEVVRYFDAVPVFVDCDPSTLCMDIDAARDTAERLVAGKTAGGLRPPHGRLRAILPMHYGGQMVDVDAVEQLAGDYGLHVIEDAAHALPAAFRSHPAAPWRSVGNTAEITCFSFYANKCITTGEGGMAVTNNDAYAQRMRTMALHGMSKDAWMRYRTGNAWHYEIVAPGFKYNLTDMAAALGLQQLQRADALREARRDLAYAYRDKLADLQGLLVPSEANHRQHSWHLFAARVVPHAWRLSRDEIIAKLAELGIGTSVHWMPLPLHPYYRKTYGYEPGLFPVAEALWPQLISLPLFPSMDECDVRAVVDALHMLQHDYGN